MTILSMETSNKTLSIALGTEDKTLASYTSQAGLNHSMTLMPAIDFLVSENNLTPKDLTGIVVAKGPGSYTGLRIGMTTAKTLSWTLNIPLYAVSTLLLISSNIKETSSLIVPLIDARRQCVFTGGYKWQDGRLVSVIPDKYINLENWLIELANLDEDIIFISEDVSSLEDLLTPFLADHEATLVTKAVTASHLLDFVSERNLVEDARELVPTYLKKVEAEEKWLETQEDTSIDPSNYVTRV